VILVLIIASLHHPALNADPEAVQQDQKRRIEQGDGGRSAEAAAQRDHRLLALPQISLNDGAPRRLTKLLCPASLMA
jgi:hypothetical protein